MTSSFQNVGLRPRIRNERGISLLEFVGCLAAMIGGVVLGAMYLGLDLKETAIAGLRRTGLVSTTSSASSTSLAPVAPGASAAPLASDPAPAPVANAPVLTPAPTPAPPKSDPTPAVTPIAVDPATSQPDPPGESTPEFTGPASDLASKILSPEDLISLTDEQRHVLTRAYWEALEQGMKAEVDRRAAAVANSANFTLFEFLNGRKEGHEQAARFIGDLKTRGVDPHVVAYAVKARTWHQEGARLFARALDLLTDAPTAQLSGPFAQSWQSASTQHQMEERLLAQKHAAVLAYLDHAKQEADAAPQPQPAQ